MPNPYFKFKQFTVFHDRCAMKVGTDGVLLGAWVQVDTAKRVLDIGTGTGLIALMVAQRSAACVVGTDIDGEAVEQAMENVNASPWKNRICICRKDVMQMNGEEYGSFDVIVSNPPYFVEEVRCLDERRDTARHTGNLTFVDCGRKAFDGRWSFFCDYSGRCWRFLRFPCCGETSLYTTEDVGSY